MRAQRSFSMFKVRRGGCEEIPLIQGKEQQLHFAGAAMKRYPRPRIGDLDSSFRLHWLDCNLNKSVQRCDGGVKLSETQIPTQEKTSFEIVYDAKAELRTWKLKTRDSRACFWQYTQTKLNGERFVAFPIIYEIEGSN
ncbi:hypothetical protein MG293_000466 [Ovis ammon polii]|uniref:Uncharacterized protein n=1 Tax=Ovis ammon polii TaxID=230172 RepID=A0AAD4ULB1_OVIAM|nr:hypothetical protein MG293_000466 [Ovis ammon polii]